MENFDQYLSEGVALIVKQALKASLTNPLETAFILTYKKATVSAERLRLKAEAEGVHIPPFLIASIASACNLYCSGCYARASSSVTEAPCTPQLSDEDWRRIFFEAKSLGIVFILLAGGEPLLRVNVLKAAAAIPEIVFPVFTNGTLFDTAMVALFHRHRNLVPMLSLEGDRTQTDNRRGAGVYDKVEVAMAALKDKGILFGASITVTCENFEMVTSAAYIQGLIDKGAKTALFVEYVQLADTPGETPLGFTEREAMKNRLDSLRAAFDTLLIIAFPGDEEAFGGCLAAGRGFFHISPTGAAEPCPFSPFSDTSLKTKTLREALGSPLFKKLELGGFLAGEHRGGCALVGREEEIQNMCL